MLMLIFTSTEKGKKDLRILMDLEYAILVINRQH
jgi:hypothetical protein